MALPLWSQLQKDLNDPETIEEAIARMIGEHNDDPEAHLGEGRSLEKHKAEEIIDHPPGSILADKETMTELSIRTNFPTLDNWWVQGSVEVSEAVGAYLYLEWGDVNTSTIRSNPQIPRDFLNSDYDMVFQVLWRSDLSNNSSRIALGFLDGNTTTSQGFGFLKNGTTLTAHARSVSTTNSVTLTGIDLTQEHIFRAFLDAYEQKIFYFVDGQQVAALDVPGSGWADDTGPYMGSTLTGNNDGQIFIGELFFSRGLVSPRV